MSDEELLAAHAKAIADVRYYHATDDIYSWRREEKERNAADKLLGELAAEINRRGLVIPKIP